MEELDALLGSSNPTIEKKADAPVVSAEAGEGKKKKKKNKTKETSEDQKTEKQPEVVHELTAEQREAAVKEALKKRNAGNQQKGKDTLTAMLEKADRQKKGAKSGKADNFDR